MSIVKHIILLPTSVSVCGTINNSHVLCTRWDLKRFVQVLAQWMTSIKLHNPNLSRYQFKGVTRTANSTYFFDTLEILFLGETHRYFSKSSHPVILLLVRMMIDTSVVFIHLCYYFRDITLCIKHDAKCGTPTSGGTSGMIK